MKIWLLFFLLFFGCWIPGARSQDVVFSNVVPPQEKTFEHITGITQDRQGFLWLASKKGLYKYDGYKISLHTHNTLNPASLMSNTLESVFADADGTLWIGSLGYGLDHFNPSTGVFTHYRHQAGNPQSLANDTITAILRDREGKLWIGTHQGLDRFDKETGRFVHFTHHPGRTNSLSHQQVRALYEDRKGTLWVGTGSPFGADGSKPEDGGLNRFDKHTGTFTRYVHIPGDPFSLSNNKVRAIFEDSRGNFWVGTAGVDGLHVLDRATGRFRQYRYDPAHPENPSRPPAIPQFTSWDHITFITEDKAGVLWIGTAGAGMHRYDPRSKTTTLFHLGSIPSAYNDGDNPWWAFNSVDNLLWIGSVKGNLFKFDPLQVRLPHVNFQTGNGTGFLEDDDGTFWFGTYNGLLQTDRQKRVLKHWTNDPKNPQSLSGNFVMKLAKESHDRIWVSTFEGGLNLFDKRKGTFTHYRHNPGNKNSLGGDFVLPLHKDRRGDWWFGTDQGLNRFDATTGTFRQFRFYPPQPTPFNRNLITTIFEDSRGSFWVGTFEGGGLHLFRREDGTFRSYLKGTSVTGVVEDKKGMLWVGGSDGLYRYNRSSDEFVQYLEPGLQGIVPDVSSMVVDKHGQLWMATSTGIVRLNAEKNESSQYGREFGVLENSLAYLSAFRTNSGELLFGDSTGFFAFHPEQLAANAPPPRIAFADFRLADKLVVPGKTSLLPQPLSDLNELQLKHNQNVFSIDFVGIDFSNPAKNRQFYTLEGYDVAWRKAGSEQRAYYFNVPPGKYRFRVKVVNSKGIWAEKSFAVTITPPWWQTWWAYTLFALLAAGTIWAVSWYKSRRLKIENLLLEQKVAERTQQLNQSLEELKATQSQLIQREKMASLGELTAGIAHEIQNPLNFVNNFADVSSDLLRDLEEATRQGDEKTVSQITADIRENLEKIHFHGDRAGSIVRNMLQHSRHGFRKKEPKDVNDLVNEYLRLCYHGIRAKDRSFHVILETHFDPEVKKVSINGEEIGRVLLNLLSNAFYAVNEKKKQSVNGYEPVVQVSTRQNGEHVEIHIKDNGNGIPRRVKEKIYQPFFTTKPAGEGTGLGLSLSYDIVTKEHNGTLQFETREGEGTEFIVKLPVG